MNISRLRRSTAKSGALTLVCAVAALATTGCGAPQSSSPSAALADQQQPSARGVVVASTPVVDLNAKEVADRLAKTAAPSAEPSSSWPRSAGSHPTSDPVAT